MTPLLEQAVKSGHDDYDSLPKSIQGDYTVKEWLWLSDHEKATLQRRECEPEHEE